MKHKRLKTRRIAEQQLTVVIFCRNPLATSLIKQVLPPEFFSVKEPPAPDADLVIVEEGLLTPTEQKILHALVNWAPSKPSQSTCTITLLLSSATFAASAGS
jgi:hypothetical protein